MTLQRLRFKIVEDDDTIDCVFSMHGWKGASNSNRQVHTKSIVE